MSRTDDLRKSGRRERGESGGGGSPFVKWGDEYTWIEGRVTDTFETKYGLAVTMKVSDMHERGATVQGKDEDGEYYTDTVRPGMEVNIGTGSAALEGKITEDDVGLSMHIAFEGWEHPKGGNRYRVFTVIPLETTDQDGVGPEPAPEPADDDLPF